MAATYLLARTAGGTPPACGPFSVHNPRENGAIHTPKTPATHDLWLGVRVGA